jgi:hypothetical protein
VQNFGVCCVRAGELAEDCNDSDNYTSSCLNYQLFRVNTEEPIFQALRGAHDQYYIYEMEMPEEYKKAFEETSREKNITTDQRCVGGSVIWSIIRRKLKRSKSNGCVK